MMRLIQTSLFLFLSISPALAESQEAVVADFCKKSTRWHHRALEALRNKGFLQPESDSSRQPVLHRGCRKIDWMTQARKAICEGSEDLASVQLPEKFLFVFDGFGGFNPKLGVEFGAVNLSGEEENDFGKGYGKGISSFMKAFTDANVQKKTFQLHYHATSGFQSRENLASALACAAEMKEYVDVIQMLSPRSELPQWVVFGFSNGGDRATEFQSKMAKRKKLEIDLVLTVDPVAQWGSFLFDQLKKTIGEKHDLTKRLVNLYQTVDRTSFPKIGLNGKPVRKATHNVHIQPVHLPLLATEKYPHTAFNSSPLVVELLTCELKALDNPEVDCDYSQFKN